MIVTCSCATGPTVFPAPIPSAVPSEIPVDTATASPSLTLRPTETQTSRPSATASIVPSETATVPPTETALPSETPTPAATDTPEMPAVSVKMQANCRYGPGTAYLYRWGLYPGDTAVVDGRNWNGSWFWIKPYNLDVHCWASKVVFNETVNAELVPAVQVPLPKTTFAGPPGNVQAVREGDAVTVSWSEVVLSDDKRRGYLLEVSSCQNGILVYAPLHTDDTAMTFTDTGNCSGKSGGLLYTAEKHGYSDPVQIPWP